MTDVYLNEKFIGNVDNPKEFTNVIRKDRREGRLPNNLNIFFKEEFDEIYISLDNGRARRPLIVVENGVSKLNEEHYIKLDRGEMNWDDLIKEGVIEYLDAAEEENALVALYKEDITKEHTHMEISPVVMLGVSSSLVPYGNFVSSSRLLIGTKNQRHAIGMYASNFLLRIDTDISLLHYPQRPITQTFMHEVFDFKEHPTGQNLVVAEMCYEGYNMEDAIIINKGSVERGVGRSTYFKPFSVEELRYSGGLMDDICIPEKDISGYKTEKAYKFLEQDGIVYSEAKLDTGEVIIGKTSPPRFLGEVEEFSFAANTRRESSSIVGEGQEGIVDMVIVTENEEGNKLIRVRLRNQRIPEVGDKFTSRHGQKGVLGLIVPETDLPFTASGIKPDIIHSPHSIPSRLSISHLIELLAGKVGALSGRFVDGTTFNSEPEKSLREELLSLGFRDNGEEVMYNGITGEVMKSRVFIGNMYFLKLKYMVANRLHARASGRIQLLTRQPIEGRAKGGGLRLGEMEKDCFIAHGASLLLKERFDSDKTVIHICENCGMLAVNDSFRGKQHCLKCGTNVDITPIEISYAFKLLLDELKSLCIYPKLILESKY